MRRKSKYGNCFPSTKTHGLSLVSTARPLLTKGLTTLAGVLPLVISSSIYRDSSTFTFPFPITFPVLKLSQPSHFSFNLLSFLRTSCFLSRLHPLHYAATFSILHFAFPVIQFSQPFHFSLIHSSFTLLSFTVKLPVFFFFFIPFALILQCCHFLHSSLFHPLLSP